MTAIAGCEGRIVYDPAVSNRRPVRLVVYDDAGDVMLEHHADPAQPKQAPSWREHDAVRAFVLDAAG